MAATRFVSVALAMLLAVTMVPAAGLPQAFADEPADRPATSGGDVALRGANGDAEADGAEVADNGLRYVVADGAATLVGFEESAVLEGALVVPETVGDGATVKAVEIAEGQVAEGVTSLTLPQAVESVRTEGLAAAFPALASVEVASGGAAAEGDGSVADGSEGAAGKGAYSSVAGMLFRSAEGQASSDGTAFADDALELVWAPPAMVVARIPLECKAIAPGAFVDAAALETVMSFGKMESIASAETDGEGNVTKPGAFTDEQIAALTVVVPGTNYAVTGEGAERVSGSVALSEKTDMLEKRKTWFHYGFDTSQIIMGAPFGEIEGVNAVSEDGAMEDRSLVTPLENGKSHLELTPEEAAEKAARRGEDPQAGLSFSYQASMDLSIRWAGDKSATPARVDLPAYAKVDDVTYQVTQVEPRAFEGAVFLTSVTIPEGITAIGESAFAGCTNLKEVSLPSTLKTIDYAAFKGTALESVAIPEGATYIGGEAFADCASLADVQSGSGTMVGSDAFVGSLVGAKSQTTGQQPTAEDPAVGEQPVDGGEEAIASSDDISPYAAGHLDSPINTPTDLEGYSTPLPTTTLDYHNSSVLLSSYYDVYYLMDRHVVGDSIESSHATPEEIVSSGQLVSSSDFVSDYYGSYNSHGSTAVLTVEVNGRRCVYASTCHTRGVASPTAETTYVAFVFVPRDDYYITGFYKYLPAGDYPHDNVFTQGLPNMLNSHISYWQFTGGYLYATAAPAHNVLSVIPDGGSSAVITPQNGSSWAGSGTKAKVGDKFTVAPKAGYTLGEVTVTGDGTSYDAATNTLTMGWGDSTVSATLIPNDINIGITPTSDSVDASIRGGTVSLSPGVYGSEVTLSGQAEDTGTYSLKLGTAATVDNNNRTWLALTPGDATKLRFLKGSNPSDSVGATLTADAQPGYSFSKWVLDEGTADAKTLGDTPWEIDYTKEHTLTAYFSGVTYNIQYDLNNGVWPGTGSQPSSAPTGYKSGQGTTGTAGLPKTLQRDGFWLAGWKWITSGSVWDDGTDEDRSFEITPQAYGTAVLKAVWKPKMYKVTYDVNASQDGDHNLATIEGGATEAYFAHPVARRVIATESDGTWALKDGSDLTANPELDLVDLAYVEDANLNYTLAKTEMAGFLYKGWTNASKKPGVVPGADEGIGPWLAFPDTVPGGSLDADAVAAMAAMFTASWDGDNTEPADGDTPGYNGNNSSTIYGVWKRGGEVPITLASNAPAEVRSGQVADGEDVMVGSLEDIKNGAAASVGADGKPTQEITYWRDKGLFVYGELLPESDPDHRTTTPFDNVFIEAEKELTASLLQFTELNRVGFRFLGWGDAATGTPYIKYVENSDASGNPKKFYLTKEGMDHVIRWNTAFGDSAAADEGTTETWDALWEIRTYQIELHVPASTVKNTNGNGWSEASYRWEQDVQGGFGSSQTVSSWRKAVKEWKYWDVFYVPYYDLNSPFNTYRGWFRGSLDENGGFQFQDNDTFVSAGQTYRKPVITEAQGQAQANGSLDSGDAAFRVTAANLGPEKLWDGADKWQEGVRPWQETDLDNVTAPDGSIELWLYTEPVYINVTAPMGVFLANDEPYVVGSDPRMALEEEATFTVKESNQDLVLTSVTATDIVEADVNQTTNQVDVKTTTDDALTTEGTAINRTSGMCYQMFDLKNDRPVDPSSGDQTKWNLDNSRIFWVSPGETVNEYHKDTNQDPGQHDMGKRVYFGFGGKGGASNNDNVVEDDPDASDDGNLLDAFRLKQGYGTAGLAGKDGHKVATDAAGASYVYDATKDQYRRTTGTGEEARTVWYAWAAKPGDANGRLILTEVGSGADGQPAHTVDVSAPITWRDYSFYYGLDLDKCSFNLGAIQSMVEAEDAWGYNVGYKKPLVKLMFTFAVERVPNVSYGAVGLSGYGAEGASGAGVDADGAAVLDTRVGTAGGAIDAEAIVSVGPATEL